MKKATEIVKNLTKKFGAKHFSRELAVDEVLRFEFKSFINRHVRQPHRDMVDKEPVRILYPGIGAVIQKVAVAPKPSFFFLNRNSNAMLSMSQLPEFSPKIPDKAAFAEQLDREIERSTRILQYKPELAHDFQGLIDIHGNLYHDASIALLPVSMKVPPGMLWRNWYWPNWMVVSSARIRISSVSWHFRFMARNKFNKCAIPVLLASCTSIWMTR
eukprot:scaffold5323_cov173-Amphora_coffeaeformis.AAC.4